MHSSKEKIQNLLKKMELLPLEMVKSVLLKATSLYKLMPLAESHRKKLKSHHLTQQKIFLIGTFQEDQGTIDKTIDLTGKEIEKEEGIKVKEAMTEAIKRDKEAMKGEKKVIKEAIKEAMKKDKETIKKGREDRGEDGKKEIEDKRKGKKEDKEVEEMVETNKVKVPIQKAKRRNIEHNRMTNTKNQEEKIVLE
jgi:hypothetical protein